MAVTLPSGSLGTSPSPPTKVELLKDWSCEHHMKIIQGALAFGWPSTKVQPYAFSQRRSVSRGAGRCRLAESHTWPAQSWPMTMCRRRPLPSASAASQQRAEAGGMEGSGERTTSEARRLTEWEPRDDRESEQQR